MKRPPIEYKRDYVKSVHSRGFTLIARRKAKPEWDSLVQELSKLSLDELRKMEHQADLDLQHCITTIHNIELARKVKERQRVWAIKNAEKTKVDDGAAKWQEIGGVVLRLLPPGEYSSGDFLRKLALSPENPFPGMTTSDASCHTALKNLAVHVKGLVLKRVARGERKSWSVEVKKQTV